jgi:AraC family transcriptional regulator
MLKTRRAFNGQTDLQVGLKDVFDTVDASGSVTPWLPIRTAVLDSLSEQLSFERAAVWLLSPDGPAPDELIAQRGADGRDIRAWCEAGQHQTPMLHDALMAGRSVGKLADTHLFDSARSGNTHAIAHALPESHPQRRWWLAVLSRSDKEFTDADRLAVDIVLRQVQTALNQPEEPGVAHALVGHDDRPISTDLAFEQVCVRLGVPSRNIFQLISDIRQQRWEKVDDDSTHDLVLELSGEQLWVIFRKTRAIDLPEATQWFVELRPPGDSQIPPIGVVSDSRIAEGIAFLHDSFQTNPSLNEMAAHVHVSPYHFHRVFSRLVGVSPKRYLQLKQLQVACRLLRTTHAPVRDVARMTGFTSHGHFNAAFRRVKGCSPTQYRASRR